MDPNANAAPAPVDTSAPISGQSTPAIAAEQQAPATQLATDAAANTTSAQAPVTNGLQLGEDIQKFLANQNIKSTDPNEIITTLVQRNQSLRSSKPADQEVSRVLSGNEQPVVQTTAPAQEASPAPTGKFSDIEIKTVEMLVKNQYKDVTANADFYREMINEGFKPVSPDGSINLQSVMNYANYKQTLSDAQKTISAAQNPAVIPEPTNSVQTMNTPVQTMNELAAQNIIIWSNQETRYGRAPHPQLNEAIEFIQNQARAKK